MNTTEPKLNSSLQSDRFGTAKLFTDSWFWHQYQLNLMSCSIQRRIIALVRFTLTTWQKIVFPKLLCRFCIVWKSQESNPRVQSISGSMIYFSAKITTKVMFESCFWHANVDSNGQITQIEGANLSYLTVAVDISKWKCLGFNLRNPMYFSAKTTTKLVLKSFVSHMQMSTAMVK